MSRFSLSAIAKAFRRKPEGIQGLGDPAAMYASGASVNQVRAAQGTPAQDCPIALTMAEITARKEALDLLERNSRAISLSLWLEHAPLKAILAYYRPQLRMRRVWVPHSDRFPNHSNMYRWTGWTGCYSGGDYGRMMDRHNLLATQPELLARKLLRYFLRRDGVRPEVLDSIEARLNEWAHREGTAAHQEAARVHGFYKGRHSQDDNQDKWANYWLAEVSREAGYQRAQTTLADAEFRAELDHRRAAIRLGLMQH